ncbi:MAG: molybdopterin converting factor subunit 1 [Planctomycetota bacterium]
MQVEILLFASLRERVGRAEVSLEVPESLTVGELLSPLAREIPSLEGRLGQVRVAVDREFSDPADRVPAGVEIALIPPVSGGWQGRVR